jgi:hypothetical protein
MLYARIIRCCSRSNIEIFIRVAASLGLSCLVLYTPQAGRTRRAGGRAGHIGASLGEMHSAAKMPFFFLGGGRTATTAFPLLLAGDKLGHCVPEHLSLCSIHVLSPGPAVLVMSCVLF